MWHPPRRAALVFTFAGDGKRTFLRWHNTRGTKDRADGFTEWDVVRTQSHGAPIWSRCRRVQQSRNPLSVLLVVRNRWHRVTSQWWIRVSGWGKHTYIQTPTCTHNHTLALTLPSLPYIHTYTYTTLISVTWRQFTGPQFEIQFALCWQTIHLHLYKDPRHRRENPNWYVYYCKWKNDMPFALLRESCNDSSNYCSHWKTTW